MPSDDPTTIVHERREVYRGRVFSLSVDRVTLPSGHTSAMDVVRHPGSVVLLPMPAPDQLILIRQYRYAVDRFIWELPAGSLNAGEDPSAIGAARECEEEIGLVPGRLELLGASAADARVLRRDDDVLPLSRICRRPRLTPPRTRTTTR